MSEKATKDSKSTKPIRALIIVGAPRPEPERKQPQRPAPPSSDSRITPFQVFCLLFWVVVGVFIYYTREYRGK
jgi:hypothetical protein